MLLMFFPFFCSALTHTLILSLCANNTSPLPLCCRSATTQSEVEDTLQRVKYQAGVEGYVICNRMGNVLRRFPAMSQEKAEQFADSLKHLAWKARSTVRDLDPTNELRYLRIRAKKHEVMVAFDNEFLVIVIQKWTPGSN